tara:strand:- start:4839 stop:6176 length:1338 start_codon:yes stop_codon:yes gene_type:complete
MEEKILVPALGESITEATVAKWLKGVGDTVKADEPIVELETDKVNLEVPSPINGRLEEVKANDGEVVKVGSLLGSIKKMDIKSEETEIKKITPTTVKKESSKLPVDTEKIIIEAEKTLEVDAEPKIFEQSTKESLNEEVPLTLQDEEPLILSNEIDKKNLREELSPAVRKIVSENKIDLKKVKGSGKGGRIIKGDLISIMGKNPAPSERKIKYGPEERIKMTRLRQTIAKRLKQAQENAAMLTTFNEVDMSGVIETRNQNQENFTKRYGVKLGFMSFFIKSCIIGLKNFPAINAEIEGENIVYKNYYNISFAVGTEKGLVVPVIKNADELSFADIEKTIKALSEKARDGKLSIEDLQGGTFTISNGGVYGSMLSTPILNPPQSGVLGMHNIVDRPIVSNGEIKIKPVMYLALSYDHRIIDGKDSVSFLKLIKENLEEPKKLFLTI